MRRAVVIVALGVVALIVYRCDRSDRIREVRAPVAASPGVKRVDPKTLASIAGTVRDDAGPIAGAFVCASGPSNELASSPTCVATTTAGTFRIEALRATEYTVVASAKQHVPSSATATVGTLVELVLARGGVELTGVVTDLAGGPIAHALVFADPALVETADDGTFSVWVAPGRLGILASADGYVTSSEEQIAPRHVELALVPEGVITGTVVDAATKTPVADVRVHAPGVEWVDPVTTDAQGAFRIARLPAGAIDLVATSPTGYGRSVGSIVVGVGATTSDVVIALYPAVTVTGHVLVDKAPCPAAVVELTDKAKARTLTLEERGDVMVAEGVLPGTYEVEVECRLGIRGSQQPPLVVGSEPVEATWNLERGGRIEGRISRRSGGSIAGLYVSTRPASGDGPRSYGFIPDARGRYAIDGVRPGPTTVSVRGERATLEQLVEVRLDRVATQDFVLDDVGQVRGFVRDEAGRPAAGCFIVLDANDVDLSAESDSTGAYVIDRVPPGTYKPRVNFRRSTDFTYGELTVRANETTRADLVAKRPAGAISGVVLDSAKRPVSDAFVKIARETDNLLGVWDELRGDRGERTMTDLEGRFALRDLPDGKYTVRAFRPAGPEVFAEHVTPDAALVLELRPTSAIAGTVRSWGSTLDDLRIQLVEERIGYRRSEVFFRTRGAFSIENLPVGHYELAAGAEGQETRIEFDLAEGERKHDLEIALVPLVTLTGRVVDHLTRAPAANIRVSVSRLGASTRFSAAPPSTSDAGGRFTITGVPIGDILVNCFARGTHETWTPRRARGTGTIDIGDVPVMRERGHGVSGESGLDLADPTFDADAKVVVESVAPGGPAAKAGIVVGDEITSIDGVDMRGFASLNAWNALLAPPGTKLAITLARGVTVDVVLASRR